jgi:hypothetical protein
MATGLDHRNTIRLFHDGTRWTAAIGGNGKSILCGIGGKAHSAVENLARVMNDLGFQPDERITSDPMGNIGMRGEKSIEQRLDRTGYCRIDPATGKPMEC